MAVLLSVARSSRRRWLSGTLLVAGPVVAAVGGRGSWALMAAACLAAVGVGRIASPRSLAVVPAGAD